MIDLNEVKRELTFFKEMVDFLNDNLINTYCVTTHPYLNLGTIPRLGSLEIGGDICSYKFHGGGCRFDFRNMIIDYQITPLLDKNNIQVKISIWKFEVFLKSVGKDITNVYNTKEIFSCFDNLVKSGFLVNVENTKGLFMIRG